jgi:hypothetical protein
VLNAINTDAFLEVRKLVLGEKLWEEKGKATGVSVKSVGPEGVHMEENFASEVKGLGRFPSGRNMGTINYVARPDGFSSGTGQGIFTAQDGDSVVWKCLAFGKPEAAGKDKSIAIIQFMTTSQKLSWMNSFLIVYESIGDMKTMEFSGTGYEWK